jgi:catechol 2,3-dioxygenase-like lactoylglutathione lyase family enzyme
MVKHFDHLTLVVRDVENAKSFFDILGFRHVKTVTIGGDEFARYMGVPGIEAEHVTLVLENAVPRTEIQLLHYLHPDVLPDPNIRNLNKIGMNHVCFAVDDLDAEMERLSAAGFTPRSDILDFHARRLIFFDGPEGVTVELSEWHASGESAQ